MEYEVIEIDLSKLIRYDEEIIEIDLSELVWYDTKIIDSIFGGGLFNFFTKCKIYSITTDIQDVSQIANQFFPSSIIDGNAYKIVQMLSEQIVRLIPESNTGYITEKLVQVTTATGAAIASGGVGADMIVNSVFTVKDGLIFAAKIIRILDDIIKTVTDTESGQTKIDDDTIKFLYNFVSINFNDSIDGVDCQIKQLTKFMENEKSRVFICELMQKAYPSMVNFVSNLISSMIPDVGVFVKETIIYMMKKDVGKNLFVKQIINTLRKQYKKLPKKFRKMIETPELLEKFIINTYQPMQEFMREIVSYVPTEQPQQNGGFMRKFITRNIGKLSKSMMKGILGVTGLDKSIAGKLHNIDEAMSEIIKYSKLIAFMINKMMAISFGMLFVFLHCHL
jgi:hypothetical protein